MNCFIVSEQIMRRNTAADSVATSMFNPPIITRYIRIILNQTDDSQWIRVELLGCKGRFHRDVSCTLS